MNDLIISPKTKVLQLIETYPQLEDVLIEYAPAFKKLKNPVLRKTVARIATLQQAAAVGNVKVEDLINHLRKEVDQDLYSGTSSTEYTTQKPDWFNKALIKLKFNAIKMLATSEHPVHPVISDLVAMGKNEIYKLIAPFLPAPLIDKATSLKIRHWVEKINDEEFNVYFYKG